MLTSLVNGVKKAGEGIKKALDFLNPFDKNYESKVVLEVDSYSLSLLEKFIDRFNGGVRTLIDRFINNTALRFIFPEGLNEQFEKATKDILEINENKILNSVSKLCKGKKTPLFLKIRFFSFFKN